jgi:hypothetical protein
VITTVCAGTWKLATPDCADPRREVFTRESAPQPGDSGAAPDQSNGTVVAVVPLTIRRPSDGSRVAVPFKIEGNSASGAMVTIVIVAHGKSGGAQAAEVAMQTSSIGDFSYEFRPPTRLPGVRYVITVSSLGPNGGRASRVVTVTAPGEAPAR